MKVSLRSRIVYWSVSLSFGLNVSLDFWARNRSRLMSAAIDYSLQQQVKWFTCVSGGSAFLQQDMVNKVPVALQRALT